MSNVYTQPSISGYNPTPPPNDGTTGSNNVVNWTGGSTGTNIKTDLADPLKAYIDAINTNALAAFAKIFWNGITAISANYSVQSSDRGKLLKASNAITVTLLASATAGEGFAIGLRNNGSSNITLACNGAETVNESATLTLYPGNSIIITCDGSNWIGTDVLPSLTAGNTWSGTQTMSALVTFSAAANFAAEVSIASAATVNIGAAASNNILITGTTTITAFDTVAAGITRHVRFGGALTLTYNATSLKLPGSANIVTAADDCAELESLGSGNWICRSYSRALKLAGALVYPSGTQSLNDSTNTTIAFNTESYDTAAIHDTVTNNDRLTVPAGYSYARLTGNIEWFGNVTGLRSLEIWKNAALVPGSPSLVLTPQTSSANTINITSAWISVVAGDYFTLVGWQNSGGALATVVANNRVWFSIELK